MEYEDRLLIYLDVLGFENYINHTQESRLEPGNKVKNVQRYLDMLNSFVCNEAISVSKTKIVTCFSDLIVISISTNEIEFFAHEIMDLNYLMYNSIVHGFLIRGAIVYGNLIHTKNQIFGPALIKGYKYERDISKFPRIIIERSIVEDILDYTGNSNNPDFSSFKNSVRIDNDGHHYLDYFKTAREAVDNLAQFIKYVKCFTELMISIADNPLLENKYNWLNDHFIDMVEKEKFLKYDWGKKTLTKSDLEIFRFYLNDFNEDEYKDKV
ncbi:MAG: hypothetical protein GY756_06935 [bacterium]|nr:hypothetical protein [bacterium]